MECSYDDSEIQSILNKYLKNDEGHPKNPSPTTSFVSTRSKQNSQKPSTTKKVFEVLSSDDDEAPLFPAGKKPKPSDSTDDILQQLKQKYNADSNVHSEDDEGHPKNPNSTTCFVSIRSKQNSQKPSTTKKVFEVLSSDDDGAPLLPAGKKLKPSDTTDDILQQLRQKYNTDSNVHSDYDETSQVPFSKKPKTYDDSDNILQQLGQKYNIDSNVKKPQSPKKVMKKQNKEEIAREKDLKKILSVQDKNLKPDQCIKFVTVEINELLVKEKYFDSIVKAISELGASHKVVSDTCLNSVTWSRRNTTHHLDGTGRLIPSEAKEKVNELLLILNWKLVVDKISKDAFVSYIHNLASGRRVILGLFGFENYFKYWKNRRRADMKRRISGESEGSNKYDRIYKDFPQISRRDLEMASTEIQILYSCSVRFVDTVEDVGVMVANFTKSIAQTPYKLQKQEKYKQLDKFLCGDNKDFVRVDKNGNGLQRLWKQQLTTFPMASLEIAEAIVSNYQSLTQLFKAYEQTDSGEKVLEKITIRRAAGPFSSTRKLGPEISKNICTYFNSMDPKALL